jgi:7,8-dihydroneopterin aldolase/epimerase/oxygenase
MSGHLLYGTWRMRFSFSFRTGEFSLVEIADRSSFLSARRSVAFCHIRNGVDDQIQIERLEVFAHVGVPDEERAGAQRLTFNITLWPICQAGELNDEIGKAVNYAKVCAEVKRFVEQRRDKLIETLANALALHLLEMFEICRIAVELRKYILPEVEFVSVTVTRERPKN